MKSTVNIATIKGCPIIIPNTIINGDGFYISYNNYDTHIYGCDTTALVQAKDHQQEHFYILNGDYRQKYVSLIKLGFAICLEYFKNNNNKISKYSEKG